MENSRVDTLPCFTKTITRTAVSTDYPSCLQIPREFWDQNQSKLGNEVVLKMNGKKWQVRVAPVKDGKAFRGTGWTAFVKENKVVIGDQVVCTMLSGSLFSVKHTRVKDDGLPVKVKEEPDEAESVPRVPNETNAENVAKQAEVETPNGPASTGKTRKRAAQDKSVKSRKSPRLTQKSPSARSPSPPRSAIRTPVSPNRAATSPVHTEARAATSPAQTGTQTAVPPTRSPSPPRTENRTPATTRTESRAKSRTPATTRTQGPTATPNCGFNPSFFTVSVDGRVELRNKSLGTEQDPVVIDISGANKQAGIHMVLKTEQDKEYKLFISASVIEKASVTNNGAAPASQETESEEANEETPAAANGNRTDETPATANGNLTDETPVAVDAVPLQTREVNVDNTKTGLPKIIIPIKTSNIAPYCRMSVEKSFAEKYLPANTCEVTVSDGAGKTWAMNWIVGPKRMLTKGWAAVVKHYNLKIGDQCILEVVDPKNLCISFTDGSGTAR